MKRKIAKVIQQSGAKAAAVFDHRATENLPQNEDRHGVKREVSDRPRVRSQKQPACGRRRGLKILLETLRDSGIDEQRQRTAADREADDYSRTGESDE